MNAYIVSQPRPGKWTGAREYVAAPSGYARRADGSVYRDGTDPQRSGPEMTWDRSEAYVFASLRYAQQQAAKLLDGSVQNDR